MILINQLKLDASAFKDETHPMHQYAIEYERGMKELKKKFPDGKIRFVRPGYPKYVSGLSAKGFEATGIPYPVPPSQFPLQTLYKHPERGTELWACCIDAPKILPGNLWDLGRRRFFSVTESMNVDIKTQADLAFYLCYISNALKSGQIKIDDPEAEIKAKADEERAIIDRKTAIWNILSDEPQLRKICQAYGISNALKKTPDALRFELEALLKKNDEKKNRDPYIKGTKDFLEEMKINDNVRLRSFIRNGIDNSFILYKPDGRYRIGEKVILQVPQPDIGRKFDYLCNYLAAPNNLEKLREVMTDLINKEYLDLITDDNDFRWLAKVMDIQGFYNKKPEQVKELVYGVFTIA
jgi:hypothetical protein